MSVDLSKQDFKYASISSMDSNRTYSIYFNFNEEDCMLSKHTYKTIYENGKFSFDDEIIKIGMSRTSVAINKRLETDYVCRVEFLIPEDILSIPIMVIIDAESISNVHPAKFETISFEKFDSSLLLKVDKSLKFASKDKWTKAGDNIYEGYVAPLYSKQKPKFKSNLKDFDIRQDGNIISLSKNNNGDLESLVYLNNVSVVSGYNVISDSLFGENSFWGRATINGHEVSIFSLKYPGTVFDFRSLIITASNNAQRLMGYSVNDNRVASMDFSEMRKVFFQGNEEKIKKFRLNAFDFSDLKYGLVGGIGSDYYYVGLKDEYCDFKTRSFQTIFDDGQIISDNAISKFFEEGIYFKDDIKEFRTQCYVKFEKPEHIKSSPKIVLIDVPVLTDIKKSKDEKIALKDLDYTLLLNKHKFKTSDHCKSQWFKDKDILYMRYKDHGPNIELRGCEAFKDTNVTSLQCGIGHFIFHNEREVVCGDGSSKDISDKNIYWGNISILGERLSLFFSDNGFGPQKQVRAIFIKENDPQTNLGNQVNRSDNFEGYWFPR